MIKDVDEIKPCIILHNYIDDKTRWYNNVHNQHWAAPADQDQGRGWNSTPSWGRSSSMVSFGRKYSRKSSNSFFLGHDDEPDYNMDHSAYQQEYTPVRRDKFQKQCETLVLFTAGVPAPLLRLLAELLPSSWEVPDKRSRHQLWLWWILTGEISWQWVAM